MEKILAQKNNFNEIKQINSIILKDIMPLLVDFLGEKNLIIEIDDIKTFAFDPFDKKILIGEKYAKKLINNPSDENILFFKTAMFHELSHYRDLKLEQDTFGKTSMKNQLQDIQNKKIPISKTEFIPISEQIHDLYNEIDDIIVNKEVLNFINFQINDKQFEYIYKTILFPYYDKNKNLILNGEIDYSDNQYHSQFSDFLLRSYMVPQQNIILNEDIKKLISSPNISILYKRLFNFLNKKQQNFKSSNDKETLERYEKIKHLFEEKKIIVANFNITKYHNELNLQYNILKQYFPETKHYLSWDIFDILKIFTLTKGIDENHRLIIPPYLRYKIIEKLFEPIQEILILLDWIENGTLEKSNENNFRKSEEGKEGEDGEEGKKGGIKHDNLDIEEKIKLLDALKKQEYKKNKNNIIPKKLNSIFDNNNVDNSIQNILNKLNIKYSHDIESLVKFFEEQLISIEKQFIEYSFESKKGKLNYDKIRQQIEQNPILPDLNKPIYDSIDFKESMEKDFKKMDFIFVIDISGSMDFHKGSNGALSTIIYIFSQALMHLEKSLQNMLKDPDYKINLNFILYGDDIGFSTLGNEHFQNMESKLKFIKSFEQIQKLSGSTDDRAGWKKVSEELKKYLEQDNNYFNEIKSGIRRPVILQIADTDITENGVSYVQNILKDIGLKQESLATKRLILGKIDEVIYSDNWKDKEINGKKIKKQEFIWNKNDIIKKIQYLFENFISEYNPN